MNDVLLVRIVTSPISIYYLFKNQFKFLKNKNINVKLITASGSLNDRIEQEEQCEIYEVPFTRRFNLIKDLLSLFRVYRILVDLKPDIVQTQTPKANIIGIIAAFMAGAKVRIVTNGGHPLLLRQSVIKTALFATMEKTVYRLSTHVWVNSRSLYQMVLNKSLAPPDKVEIVADHGSSNGVDLKRFRRENLHQNVINEIKIRIGYLETDFHILTIGRLVREKGIEDLVEAIKMLRKKRQNVKLLLIGSFENDIDPIDQDIKHMIETDPAIIHIEWSEQVEYYLSIADIFVHPSHREGFSQVLLQAGAMKCPVLSSDAPGNIDLISDRSEGVIFKSKDRQDLFEKIIWAMDNQSCLTQYSDNLYSKVCKLYDQEIVHEKIYQRYRQILNEKRDFK